MLQEQAGQRQLQQSKAQHLVMSPNAEVDSCVSVHIFAFASTELTLA